MAPLSFDVSSAAGLTSLNEYLATRSYITGCVPRLGGAVGLLCLLLGFSVTPPPGQASARQLRVTTAPVPWGGQPAVCGNQLRVRRFAGSLLFCRST
jgi:hypothetical protein